MKTLITEQQLVDLLKDQKCAAPITISAFVSARPRKTGNPYDDILKFSVVNGFTGHDYENSVNRQRIREGMTPDFHARDRAWGSSINNCVSTKDGKFYLRIRPLRSKNPIYYVKENGALRRVRKAEIERFLPPTSHSAIQGTAKEIYHREYSIANIRTVNFGGRCYEILH